MTQPESLPGLTRAEVETARRDFGFNEMPKLPPPPWWRTAFKQFQSPLVVILAVAAGAAALLGEGVDAIVIGAVLILNAVLGFVQEWRAENALSALTAMLDPIATVRRDGRETEIPAREIVPGDILLLATGDRVPADGTLVVSRSAEFDESVLTGESLPVKKSTQNVVSSGTTVVAGTAEALVTGIGRDTAFAEIAALTGGIDRRPTQLQIALGVLARWLGIAAILVALAVGVIGVLAGQELLDMALTAISLAVAMVPEGLPAVVTITLALGAGAMVRKQALVRRMQAIETLGAASVICTDKTGTLTENKMHATTLWCAGRQFDVAHLKDQPPDLYGIFHRIARVGQTCTHASLVPTDAGDVDEIGNPTEIALLRLANALSANSPAEMIREIPFSSERKRMSVLTRDAEGLHLLVKGAPEFILARASRQATSAGDEMLSESDRLALTEIHEKMASRGLRVIALADRPARNADDLAEDTLVLLGFVGLMDPPRVEVADAISRSKDAGIRVIMITGDGPVTARAIAEQLSIPVVATLTGDDLKDMNDEDLAERLAGPVLFARTRPADKLRIIDALQQSGAVIAMTGDGVNDAPALKKADIGVAMGQRGTAVAQEAADVILLDDNFATIVNAIDEGRRQFANIKKFVRYLMSSNAGEVVALVANLLIGGPLIFLATQILWMNLITDGVTAVALGLEKAEPDIMKEAPRKPGSPILGKPGLGLICVFGFYTGGASLFLFYTFLPVDPALANTVAFTAMVVFEKVSVFAFRSLRSPVGKIGWFSNRSLIFALLLMLALQIAAVYVPFMQVMLHTVPLGVEHWQWITLLALPLIIVPEVVKWVRLFREQRQLVPAKTDASIHSA